MSRPYTKDASSSFYDQIIEYRKFHALKKEREDFIRNSSMVSFLFTSKYSTAKKPAVLTTLRVEHKKSKTTFEHFKGIECKIYQREPGSWFQSSFK
jgi:hypothetical protein